MPTDEERRNEWIRVLTSMSINPSSDKAPQFDYGNWHFAVSKVRRFKGLDIRYGTKAQTKNGQPRLQDFLGDYHSPRGQANGWAFFRRIEPHPSELRELFNSLTNYEKSPDFLGVPVVLEDGTLSRNTTASASVSFTSESELEEAIFTRKEDMVRDLGISLMDHHVSRPDNPRSKIDLVGVRTSTGATVLIELKLRPLADAVHRIAAYLIPWKELYPQNQVEGVYLIPNTISRRGLEQAVADADQFRRTRGLHIAVVSFHSDQGVFRYQAHGP